MRQTLIASRMGCSAFLSFLIINVTSVATAQRAKIISKGTVSAQSNDIVRPQLLNGDTNPTLRFPIARQSGIRLSKFSYGWLDISGGKIHYTVDQPPEKLNEGFDASTAEIRSLKL